MIGVRRAAPVLSSTTQTAGSPSVDIKAAQGMTIAFSTLTPVSLPTTAAPRLISGGVS